MKIKMQKDFMQILFILYSVYKIFIFVKSDREMTYVIFQPGSLTKKHLSFNEGQNVKRVMGKSLRVASLCNRKANPLPSRGGCESPIVLFESPDT